VKLVAEFETGETTEVEVARIERDEQAGLSDLGLPTGCGFLKAVKFGCKPPWSWIFCRRQRIG